MKRLALLVLVSQLSLAQTDPQPMNAKTSKKYQACQKIKDRYKDKKLEDKTNLDPAQAKNILDVLTTNKDAYFFNEVELADIRRQNLAVKNEKDLGEIASGSILCTVFLMNLEDKLIQIHAKKETSSNIKMHIEKYFDSRFDRAHKPLSLMNAMINIHLVQMLKEGHFPNYEKINSDKINKLKNDAKATGQDLNQKIDALYKKYNPTANGSMPALSDADAKTYASYSNEDFIAAARYQSKLQDLISAKP